VLARLQQQLARDMAALGLLRLFQPQVRALEVGAGVMQVGIQEAPEQRFVEVVMGLDVALAAPGRVDLAQPAAGARQPPAQAAALDIAMTSNTRSRPPSPGSQSPSMYASPTAIAGLRSMRSSAAGRCRIISAEGSPWPAVSRRPSDSCRCSVPCLIYLSSSFSCIPGS
jgi:hypothetical protein